MKIKLKGLISALLAAVLVASTAAPTVFAAQEISGANVAVGSLITTFSAETNTQPEATVALDSNVAINATNFPDKNFTN